MLGSTSVLRVLGAEYSSMVQRKCESTVLQPKSVALSLPFVPPPRWATSVPTRLDKAFPSLERKRNILFMRALIHPSYTTESANEGTMASLCSVGQSVLTHTFQCAVANAAAFSAAEHLNSKLCAERLTSDEALSAVLKGFWGLEDMILTDAVVREVRDARTSRGLLRISTSPTTLPLSYHRMCVQAVVGAVYADSGLRRAMVFSTEHIFPHAVEYLAPL
jgi:dsRNA-specific ribonuclease